MTKEQIDKLVKEFIANNFWSNKQQEIIFNYNKDKLINRLVAFIIEVLDIRDNEIHSLATREFVNFINSKTLKNLPDDIFNKE